MKDSTAAKVVTVFVNILITAGLVFLWILGSFGISPISFWMGPKVIYGKNFIWGIFILAGCILIPIGVNALLSLLHKKYGVSERWSKVPAVIVASTMGSLILYTVLSVGTGFFAAEWKW